MKVLTVLGTRPEIIRLSRVIARLDDTPGIEHVLVHTGQNYDYELNEIFFDDLDVRAPDHFLNVSRENRRPSLRRHPRQIRRRLAGRATRRRPGPRRHQLCHRRRSSPSACTSRSSTWRPATAASTRTCPKRSTARSSTTSPTINLVYTEHARRNLLAEGLQPREDLPHRLADARSARSSDAEDRSVDRHRRTRPGARQVLPRLSPPRRKRRRPPTPRNSSSTPSTPCMREHGLPVVVSLHPRTRNRTEALGHHRRRRARLPAALRILRLLPPPTRRRLRPVRQRHHHRGIIHPRLPRGHPPRLDRTTRSDSTPARSSSPDSISRRSWRRRRTPGSTRTNQRPNRLPDLRHLTPSASLILGLTGRHQFWSGLHDRS